MVRCQSGLLLFYFFFLKPQPVGENAVCVCLSRTARLQLTDELIGELGEITTSRDADEDLQRIQELLGSPQGEDARPSVTSVAP